MQPEIRKIVTYDEEVLIEGFRVTDKPWRMFALAAVLRNPWAGRYVEDLKPEIQAYGPVLGEMMTSRMLALAGSGDAIEAYGKAAVVGLNGEIEHASGLIHTLRFGNHYREAVGAKSYLAFTNTRGGANAHTTRHVCAWRCENAHGEACVQATKSVCVRRSACVYSNMCVHAVKRTHTRRTTCACVKRTRAR